MPKVVKPIAKCILFLLKKWDIRKATSVDHYIANSKEVQARIKNIYGRESELIYPFVDTSFWKPEPKELVPTKPYFLIAGRLQYAKGLDVVVEAFNEISTQYELHVVGSGRYEKALKEIVKNSNIKFLGRLSDEDLRKEFSSAEGYIYPQLEDFGIMPLEAAACGTPTIGLKAGGSLETIEPGLTGELYKEITKDLLLHILPAWEKEKYSKDYLMAHASKFSKEKFTEQLTKFVELVYENSR
jgi:glycosyltransferase involved in cell wall biosynthesis